MLLPLPAPPPPPACSLLRPAPSHGLLPSAAAAPTPLFPSRLLRSRTSPFRELLTSPPSTSASSPFACSFAASSPGTFHRSPNWAANGESEDEDEESIVGDCLVFEEGAFEGGDPFLPTDPDGDGEGEKWKKKKKPPRRKPDAGVSAEALVPEKWREVVSEINLTKKEKRRIAQELKFGSRIERRKKLPVPDLEEYRSYRAMKLSQLKPVVLDDPREFAPSPPEEEVDASSGGRVSPRNPRLGVGDESLELISDFFNSGEYVPGGNDDDGKKPGKRKLFTKEEKVLLNRRMPNLADATSNKWLPLHTLAAAGEFYLLDALLKHSVDINAADKDGLSALHNAILGNKVAIVNYLLRESANPFVRDQDGGTLMHYAVLTASSPIIKILLLYDVDVNLPDDDGWTPLHLAVQTLRTDVVRLLLIKGADKTLKNKDGLTPLDLCLYSGQNSRTYELIKLLKELPKSK